MSELEELRRDNQRLERRCTELERMCQAWAEEVSRIADKHDPSKQWTPNVEAVVS